MILCRAVFVPLQSAFKFLNEANEFYQVVPFLWICKVVKTFELVNEILKCDHSNESY